MTAIAQEAELEMREWTDATGKYKTQAALVQFKDGRVYLRTKDGRDIDRELAVFSDKDKAYVRDETARRRKAAEAPAKSKAGVGGKAAGGSKSSGSKTGGSGASESGSGVAKGGDAFDWPQWRGPNRDGISAEKGLLKSWPPDGPPLLWRIEGLGGGFSSVSVSQGKVFTMGVRGKSTELIALDAQSGREIWSVEVGGRERPNCTPTVDGDLVFAVSFEGDLLCADSRSGQEKWRKNFGRDFKGQMMSTWGYSESPLVDDDRLICTPGGPQAMLAALNKRNGQVVWAAPMPNVGNAGKDGAAYSSIVVSNGGGTKQYVQLVGRGLFSVAAKNGQPLWAYNRIANATANIPTPIVFGDQIFCSTGYGTGAALLKLTGARGLVNANEVYFNDAPYMQNHHGGMVLVDDHIYCGHGHNEGFPFCLNVKTGKRTWKVERGPGRGSAAIMYADGHLYFRYEDGVMALIEANPQELKIKSTFELPSKLDKSWPHPVVANGRLYLRDQQVLLCYDIRERS